MRHETAREVWQGQGALDGSHILTGCGACEIADTSLVRSPIPLKAVGDGWG
jgi:hypothetical protein